MSATIQLSESTPTVVRDVKPLFTASPIERLTYAIQTVPPQFASFASVDARTGQLTVTAQSIPNPSTYIIQTFAVNQFNKRSPPYSFTVTEVYTGPPVPNPANPPPTTVLIHNKAPSASIDLPPTFLRPSTKTVGFRVAASANAPAGAMSFDANTSQLTFRAINRSHSFQVTVTAFLTEQPNKATSHIITVTEEWVQPPQIVQTPTPVRKAPATIDLTSVFIDHTANATLTVVPKTPTTPALTFAITAVHPLTETAAVQLDPVTKSKLIISETATKAIKSTTVTATNSYGLTQQINIPINLNPIAEITNVTHSGIQQIQGFNPYTQSYMYSGNNKVSFYWEGTYDKVRFPYRESKPINASANEQYVSRYTYSTFYLTPIAEDGSEGQPWKIIIAPHWSTGEPTISRIEKV